MRDYLDRHPRSARNAHLYDEDAIASIAGLSHNAQLTKLATAVVAAAKAAPNPTVGLSAAAAQINS